MTFKPEKFKISRVKNYTEDVKLFKVKNKIHPLPGQFFQVSVLGIGECPLASCSYDKNYMDILIRNAGSVTSQIFKLKTGDNIFIRGPYGKGFPVKKFENKNLILVAGGTGIAPITSLIEYVEKNRKKFKEISIFFGFRNPEYILLRDKIKKWNKKFNVFVCLENPGKSKKYEKGFVCDAISLSKKHIKNSAACLCGPEIMMSTTTEKLNQLGIKNNKIYWSLERRMECGFGSCGRCLLQDGYVCKDGPVFRYDKIKPKLDNEYSSQK